MAIDASALPTDSLGPVQTDTSGMDATAALNTPAWGPNSPGASAEPPPLPEAPDFARIIPISTIEAAKQQQAAEEWGQQQQAKIADLWGQFAQDRLDQTIQRYTQPQWGPAQPMAYDAVQPEPAQPTAPPDAMSGATPNPVVDQFLSGLGGLLDKLKPNPQDAAQAGDTSKVLPTLESVAAPAGEALNRLTGGKFGEATGQLGNVTMQDLAQKANDLGLAGPVTQQDIQQMPGKDLTVGDVASTAASMVQPTPAGPVPGAALTPAGRAAGAANVLEGASPAAAIAGAASDTFDMSHPLVQYIAQNAGDEVAQKAVATLNNPARMQRILRAPARITTEADQAAYQIYRGSKDAALVEAARQQTGVGQAVLEAAPAHQPDAELSQQLQQSVENAQANPAGAGRVGAETSPPPESAPPIEAPAAAPSGETASPPVAQEAAPTPSSPAMPPASGSETAAASAQNTSRVPVWQQGLALVGHTDPVVEDALVRNAAREELAANTAMLPSGRMPGGIEAQATAERAAGEQQAVNSATRAVNQDTLRQGAEQIAANTPPPPESPFGPGGASAPPEVSPATPGGRAPGNQPPATPPVSASTALRLGSQAAGAAAGGYYEWQQSDKDLSLATIARVAAGMAGGAAAGYIGLGGAPTLKATAARAMDSYIGGLVSARTIALKGVQDGTDILLGGPAIKFAQATLAGHPAVGAQQAVQMYHALADGVGVVAGLRAAVKELSPGTLNAAERFGSDATDALSAMAKKAEHSVPSPGQYAATASTRGISAITEFARQLMTAQEMAADRVAMSHGLQSFGSVEDQAARVQKIVNDRLLMGDPNGGLGKAALAIMQLAQKMPILGGRLGTPFARIPANFMDKAFSAIPAVGLLNMAGATSKQTVLAQQALGSMALLGLKAAFGDNVTGAGPSDPAQAGMWRDNGYQPYSVKLPGTNQWTSTRNLPFWLKGPAMFLGLANDVQNGWNDGGKLGAAAAGFGKAVGSQEFMPDLLKLVENGLTPGQTGGEAVGAVPWYLRQTNAGLRNYIADTKGTAQQPANAGLSDKIGSAVSANLQAGVNGQVPARQTVMGDQVPNSNQGLGVFSPFQSTTEQRDPVIDAFGKVGVNIPQPPTNLTVGRATIPMTGAQRQEFQQVRGQALRDLAAKTPVTDAATAQKLLVGADKIATDQMIKNHPELTGSAQSSKQAKVEAAASKGRTWAQLTSGAASPPAEPAVPTAATGTGGRTWKDLVGSR